MDEKAQIDSLKARIAELEGHQEKLYEWLIAWQDWGFQHFRQMVDGPTPLPDSLLHRPGDHKARDILGKALEGHSARWWSQVVGAWLRDRAHQWDPDSGIHAAVLELAANVKAGDAIVSWDHGELDDLLDDSGEQMAAQSFEEAMEGTD